MDTFEAVQILLICDKNSEDYKLACDFLIRASKIDEKADELLTSLLKTETLDIPLKIQQLAVLPNLFTLKSESNGYDNLVSQLLKLAVEKNLKPKIIEQLHKMIMVKREPDKKYPNGMILLAILLRVYYGIEGIHLPEDKKEVINTLIRKLLCSHLTKSEEETFSKVNKELLEVLVELKQYLCSTDKLLRLKARDICEDLQLSLDFQQMVSLSVDGMFGDLRKPAGDLVLFIGPTGVGKSTLVNYLYGTKYVRDVDHDSGEAYLKPAPGEDLPPAGVGHGINSKTLYPRIVISKDGNGFSYCDCPGFNDTNEGDIATCASLGMPIAVKYAAYIRAVVIVLEWDATSLTSFGKGGNYFCQVLKILQQLLKRDSTIFSGTTSGDDIPLLFVFSKPKSEPKPEPKSDTDIIPNPDTLKRQLRYRIEKIITNRKERYLKLPKKKERLRLKQKQSYKSTILLKKTSTWIEEDFQNKLVVREPASSVKVFGDSDTVETIKLSAIADKVSALIKELKEEKIDKELIALLEFYYREMLSTADKDERINEIRDRRKKWEEERNGADDDIRKITDEIDELESEQYILNLILKNNNNAFIIRGYEHTSSPDHRTKLLESLVKLRTRNIQIGKDQFHFDIQSPNFDRVRSWVEDFSNMNIGLVKELINLKLKEKVLDDMRKARVIEYEKYRIALKIELSKNIDLREEEHPLKQKIDAGEIELKKASEELDKLKQQEASLNDKINRIQEDKTEVEYASRLIRDERSWVTNWWFGRSLGFRTAWTYKFPGTYYRSKGFFDFFNQTTEVIPIERYELSVWVNKENRLIFKEKSNGKVLEGDDFTGCVTSTDPSAEGISTGNFTENTVDREKGQLNLTYYSESGKDGLAGVRVFVLVKNLPDSRRAIENIREEIRKNEVIYDLQSKSCYDLRNRVEKDKLFLNIIRLNVLEVEDKYNRVNTFLYHLGWNKDEFISGIFSKSEKHISWLAITENCELLMKLANCSAAQFEKLPIYNKAVMIKYLGIKEDSTTSGKTLSDEEFQDLRTKVSDELLNKIGEVIHLTSFPVIYLHRLLQFDFKSLQKEKLEPLHGILAALEKDLINSQRESKAIHEEYLTMKRQLPTFYTILSVIDSTRSKTVTEFSNLLKQLENETNSEGLKVVVEDKKEKEKSGLLLTHFETQGLVQDKSTRLETKQNAEELVVKPVVKRERVTFE